MDACLGHIFEIQNGLKLISLIQFLRDGFLCHVFVYK